MDIKAFYTLGSNSIRKNSNAYTKKCNNKHITIVLDVSESVDNTELTEITTKILNLIKKSNPSWYYSVIAFAGKAEMIFERVQMDQLSIESLMTKLFEVKTKLPVHTNWIGAFQEIESIESDHILFITDGWHNGTKGRNDSIINDLFTITDVVNNIKGNPELMAIPLSQMNKNNGNEIFKLFVSKNVDGGYQIIKDENSQSWQKIYDLLNKSCDRNDFALELNTIDDDFKLTWNKIIDHSKYKIFRKGINDSNWERINIKYTNINNVFTAYDIDIKPGTYLYQVFTDDHQYHTGIKEGIIDGLISIFPNPANDIVLVKFNLSEDKINNLINEFHLHDIYGKEVRVDFNMQRNDIMVINTEHLISGTYILTFSNKESNHFQSSRINIIH